MSHFAASLGSPARSSRLSVPSPASAIYPSPPSTDASACPCLATVESWGGRNICKLGEWTEWTQIGGAGARTLCTHPLRDDRFPGRFDRHSTARCLILKFRYSIPAPSSLSFSLLYAPSPSRRRRVENRSCRAAPSRNTRDRTDSTTIAAAALAPLRRCRVVEYECRFFTWRRRY